jgi:FkbM family methyltransferase
VKTVGQTLLRNLGLYHRVKSSFAYDLYWRVADRRLIEERDSEVEFFRRNLAGLQRGDLIFDIGANRGHKTDIFLRLGARVVAVEPDESNQKILRESFLSYRIARKPVTIVGSAVSDESGVGTMWVDEPGSAKNTLNAKWVQTLQTDRERFGQTLQFGSRVEVKTVTLEELTQRYGRPFYVKIDVEGHEPSVLRGLHRPVPFVSFEVNLPEFKGEAAECVDLLHELSPSGQLSQTSQCRGLLKQWLSREEFLQQLDACAEPSIEVFWRANPA